MAIPIIIQNEKAQYLKAREMANQMGTTLTTMIEKLVAETAKRKIADSKRFIHEAKAENEVWCGSRATLYAMRKSGELKKGEHFVIKEGLIFYKYAALKKHFDKNYPHIKENNLRRLERSQNEIAENNA